MVFFYIFDKVGVKPCAENLHMSIYSMYVVGRSSERGLILVYNTSTRSPIDMKLNTVLTVPYRTIYIYIYMYYLQVSYICILPIGNGVGL